jgi:hypothetical protein
VSAGCFILFFAFFKLFPNSKKELPIPITEISEVDSSGKSRLPRIFRAGLDGRRSALGVFVVQEIRKYNQLLLVVQTSIKKMIRFVICLLFVCDSNCLNCYITVCVAIINRIL